ncbi:MAG TPA: zinc dependent phospholipase C family protein [Blastocatellia bacterium]
MERARGICWFRAKLVRMLRLALVVGLVLGLNATGARAYSVLTHEALIDSAWDDSIKPLLVQRFPSSTPAELREAHSYAYGGAIIQDMGYYPFGSKLFSDLTHYVRSGGFIVTMIRDSQDLNEYAFSLGALCHYAADSDGHSIAVNPSVALEYPKLKTEFGPTVTYEQNPTAHIRTEFGFDVVQVARGRYASQAYHDFVGFRVSKPLLERAFKDTYGIELKSLFTSLNLALGSYRRTVSTVIPEMSKVAWDLKKDDIQKEIPGTTRRKFIYNLSRASYEREWGNQYQKPGPFASVLAFMLRIIPKAGPFKALSIKPPTPQTEKFFMQSFDASLSRYRGLLGQVRSGSLTLEDRNLDTGNLTRPNTYVLADHAYATLLEKISEGNFAAVTPDLRANILMFYSAAPQRTPAAGAQAKTARKDAEQWNKTMDELARLKTFQPTTVRTGGNWSNTSSVRPGSVRQVDGTVHWLCLPFRSTSVGDK